MRQAFASKKLILMAGNIGSGKTSLTRLLGKYLGCETAFESVADNPYLSDFYADMRTWSFHLQMYFLGNRALTPHPYDTEYHKFSLLSVLFVS